MHASECLEDPSTLRELNLDSFPLLVVHTLWRGMQICKGDRYTNSDDSQHACHWSMTRKPSTDQYLSEHSCHGCFLLKKLPMVSCLGTWDNDNIRVFSFDSLKGYRKYLGITLDTNALPVQQKNVVCSKADGSHIWSQYSARPWPMATLTFLRNS